MLRRPSRGTEIRSASCAGCGSTDSGSSMLSGVRAMRPLRCASMVVPPARSPVARLRSPLDSPSEGFEENSFFRRDMGAKPSGNASSADAQELGLLGKGLQVDLLPVGAGGIGVPVAEPFGRTGGRPAGGREGVGIAQAGQAVDQQGAIDF